MGIFSSRRFKAEKDGSVVVRLSDDERAVVGGLSLELRELLDVAAPGKDEEDDGLRRLFPPAYTKEEDKDQDMEYRVVKGDELLESHQGALALLRETAANERLTPDEAYAWMQALNQLRLVLGTRLGVTEEGDELIGLAEDDPLFHGFVLYDYLTHLQGELIDALESGL